MNVLMTLVLEHPRDRLPSIETVITATLYGSYVCGDLTPRRAVATRLLDRAVGFVDAMEVV